MKKRTFLSAVFGLMLVGTNASATLSPSPVDWIDWTSTTEGTLDIGGTLVGVTMTGNALDYVDGDYYYNNANTGGTSAAGTYAGLVPEDLIRVNQSSSFTLNFDRTIVDPYMALVSVGQRGLGVSYAFEDDVSLVSEGSNWWGPGSYGIVGSTFTGNEFNGVLQLSGSFDSISFNIENNEHWHGFNFGTSGVRVPEPSVLALFGLGLFGMTMAGLRRKAS